MILTRIIGILALSAATAFAQTKLTKANRNVVIESARVGEAKFQDGHPFLISQPLVDYSSLRTLPVDNSNDPVAQKIQAWFDEGTAAGNVGDCYENRDGNHSRLNLNRLQQIAEIKYGEEFIAKKADFGAKLNIANDRPTIVNASLAMVNTAMARSMARLILHNPEFNPQLYSFYRMGDIICYPEHNDYDRADLFAVNTPYLIISQGSSGTDQPFMIAVAQTLASFHPAVKERLHQYGLIAPTVQMIMRWNYQGIGNAENYLTGAAHPTVFDGNKLNRDAMAEMAHNMKFGCLPPLALIKMIEEKVPVNGVDYFDAGASEVLIDTPCAIGRIARSLDYTRTFRVSAADSMDVQKLPLTYHWRVLRGDESLITITPLNEDKTEVEISVDYQSTTMVPDQPTMKSHRVDIGAFVDNGTYYSAPAFISIWYPPNEQRKYDRNERIESVTYLDPRDVGPTADLKLAYHKPWRDSFDYDGSQLAGWTRTMNNGDSYEFNAAGERAESSWFSEDKVAPVTYEIETSSEGYQTVKFN